VGGRTRSRSRKGIAREGNEIGLDFGLGVRRFGNRWANINSTRGPKFVPASFIFSSKLTRAS
jgi:hypothetical protein